MANGLPYSIGAAVAYPGRQVVCIIGDGGFTMLMGEIATLVKYHLPVKVIVIKNNVARADQMGADGHGGQPRIRRASCSRSISPCMRGRAAPPALPSTTRLNARACCAQAMAHPGPAVVEAVVDPNEPPLPGNITIEQSIHFAEALAKDEKNRWKVLKTLAENKVREVV